MSFPLKTAVQKLKIRKNKTIFVAIKGKLIFLALLGRFGVWGIGTPKLLVLLVAKEHMPHASVEIAYLFQDEKWGYGE